MLRPVRAVIRLRPVLAVVLGVWLAALFFAFTVPVVYYYFAQWDCYWNPAPRCRVPR
jgi:hypothetical protein